MKRREFVSAGVGAVLAGETLAFGRPQAAATDGGGTASDGGSGSPLAQAATGRGFQAPLRFDAAVEDC